MEPKPFLLCLSQVPTAAIESRDQDVVSEPDPSPAVLEISAAGYVLSRGTRVTAAKPETTDDN
jgi:hypothetical protein